VTEKTGDSAACFGCVDLYIMRGAVVSPMAGRRVRGPAGHGAVQALVAARRAAWGVGGSRLVTRLYKFYIIVVSCEW
jgi:hypothetical protein